MSRLLAFARNQPILSAALRYVAAIAAIVVAFAAESALEHLHVRNPYALIFLGAFTVIAWYVGDGPGILAFVLSSLGMISFLHSPGAWFEISSHDLPVFCIFVLFGLLIYSFSRTQHRAERLLWRARNELESQVAARTSEFKQLNTEYKTILDAAPFGVVLLGPGRVVVRCNPAYEAMLGWKPGELIGKLAPLPHSEQAAWSGQEERLRAGFGFLDYEGPRIRRDGSEFPASISATPLFGACGYQGVVGLIIDMTERRAHEFERQMLTAMVQHSPDFIGVADMDGTAIFVNRAGQTMFGLIDEQVKQTKVIDYFAESERDRAQHTLIPTLLRAGQLEFETIGRNLRTGEHFPLYCNCFVIPDSKTGASKFIAAVARDITDRKKAEEELRRRDTYLTEGQSISHTASWGWNSETGRGFWSAELYRILGLGPDIAPPSLHLYAESVHPDDRDDFRNQWQTAIEDKTNVDCKHRILRPDGTIRHVHSLGHTVPTNDGTLEHIGTVMDMTEHYEHERALQVALHGIQRLLDENKALQEQQRKENISLQESNQALQDEIATIQKTRFEKIIGSSLALHRTLLLVDKVAPTDSTVLITGETGTGKELIAQAIHHNSNRAGMPFIAVNCAAIASSLITTELFGFERGGFTGADRRHLGRFDLAAGGTIFLDEIGEVPLETQLALLRVLQERAFERVGGSRLIPIDVRVIAATNRDLYAAMADGSFRKDLFYRLNTFPIDVPPLRERRDDIPNLVRHFIGVSAGKLGKKIPNIEKRSMELLLADDWPGNIRQLQNAIEAAVIACDGETLTVDKRLLSRPVESRQPVALSSVGTPLQQSLDEYERKLIEESLVKCNGQIGGPSGAAYLLAIPSSTLRSRMKTLKINPHRFKTNR